jgi:hypothetical protein
MLAMTNRSDAYMQFLPSPEQQGRPSLFRLVSSLGSDGAERDVK